MNVTAHDIDKMEDTRVLCLARVQGPFGQETARRHANALMNRAMNAFDEGNVNAAIRLTAREFDFNCRAFGFSHTYTLASKNCLAALKEHYSRTAWRSACNTHQLKVERSRSVVA